MVSTNTNHAASDPGGVFGSLCSPHMWGHIPENQTIPVLEGFCGHSRVQEGCGLFLNVASALTTGLCLKSKICYVKAGWHVFIMMDGGRLSSLPGIITPSVRVLHL